MIRPDQITPPPFPRHVWEILFLTALLTTTIWVACFNFPEVWTISGIGEADKPFLDLRNMVSAGEAVQLGFDPYVSNPLDPYHRLHGYTDWWLLSGTLGLTRADIAWLGALLLGCTLASAVLLLQPASLRQGGILLLVLASPPLLFAVNRANPDLVVFVIMCAALACLRRESTPSRAFGVVLLAVSAVLKYFPLAAVVVLLDARSRRELAGWALLYGLVLLLAWPSLERGLHNAVSHQPAPDWLYAFGAPVILRNFAIEAPPGWLLAGFVGLTAAASWPSIRAALGPSSESDALTLEREFACGAVMVVGCFLHGSSYVYKLVFALWLLPLLWRTTPAQRDVFWRQATLGLLLVVLWFEGGLAAVINVLAMTSLLAPATGHALHAATQFVSQLLTWALVVCLGRALLLYLIRQLKRLGFIALITP